MIYQLLYQCHTVMFWKSFFFIISVSRLMGLLDLFAQHLVISWGRRLLLMSSGKQNQAPADKAWFANVYTDTYFLRRTPITVSVLMFWELSLRHRSQSEIIILFPMQLKRYGVILPSENFIFQEIHLNFVHIIFLFNQKYNVTKCDKKTWEHQSLPKKAGTQSS